MRTRLVNQVQAQPRLLTAILVGVLLCIVLPLGGATRLLVAWDCSTALYLVLTLWMMAHSDIEVLRFRAAKQDEGQLVILGLITITALVSLAGIMAQLVTAKSPGSHGRWHVVLAVSTVFLSWSVL